MTNEQRNALQPGYQLEEYRIERVLGAGGFGVTYLATDTALARQVAIKEYLPAGIAARLPDELTVKPISSSENEDFDWGMNRFRMEAETLVGFRHPNIVTVLRLFEANGTAYLVMAYEEGESLANILERDGHLTETEVYELLFPLLAGLELVHQAGFLHRDIKPSNIYIRADGSPVLLDFGSARLAFGQMSRSLTSVVSAGYAPFEQYSTHGNQGPWTDIYAMGGVLYRAVTGMKPPDATDRIRSDPIVPAAKAAAGRCTHAFLTAIDAALAVDEADRPQSIAEWRRMFPIAAARAVGAEAQLLEAPGPDDEPTGAAAARQPATGPESETWPGGRIPSRPPGAAEPGVVRRLIPWVLGALLIVMLGAGGTYGIIAYVVLDDDDSGVRVERSDSANDAGTAGQGEPDWAARTQIERERAERERLQREAEERAEQERLRREAAERAEREARERAEQERLQRERAERESGGSPDQIRGYEERRRRETRRDTGTWRRHAANRFDAAWCDASTVRVRRRSVAALQPRLCVDPRLRASDIRYNDTTIVWRITTAKGTWLDCLCRRPR